MQESIQETNSHQDKISQKFNYKYFSKRGGQLNEKTFRKEAIKNRDFQTWNISINRGNRLCIKWRKQFPGIKSSKRIQKLNIELTKRYPMTKEGLACLGKALKRQSLLRKVNLVAAYRSQSHENELQKFIQGVLKFCTLENFNLLVLSEDIADQGLKGINRGLKKFAMLRSLSLKFYR